MSLEQRDLISVQVIRRAYFSSAVRCYSENLSQEANQKLYGSLYSDHGMGHNYILDCYVTGPVNQESGMVIGISELDTALREITSTLDHRFLNYDIPYFKTNVPTAENIAKYSFDRLRDILSHHYPGLSLLKVRLYETEDFWVDYGVNLSNF